MRLLQNIAGKLRSGHTKVLVIQTAFLGDVILTTPLLRAFKESFPKALLTVLVLPQFAKMVEPFVDQVIVFEKRDQVNRSRIWHELINQLRLEKFDLALIPHRSSRSGITALRAGIPLRIGFKRGAGALFHTHRVAYPYNMYEGQRNIELLRKLTDIIDGGLPELRPSDQDNNKVNQLLKECGLINRPFVVFAPGSVWLTKRWLPEYYKELSQLIYQQFNLPVVTIGGKEDGTLCNKISSNIEYNFSGKLSPLESTAVIKRAKLIVSGDSAPAHMATAVGTRQVVIFGSTTPRFGFAANSPKIRLFGIDKWCRPCTGHGRKHCPINTFRCMHEVKPAEIFETVKDWLE